MKLAFITLSPEGAALFAELKKTFAEADYFLHDKVEGEFSARRFARVADLTGDIFGGYEGLVYIAPSGAVVRAIAPHVKDKMKDPAVLQIDVGGRWVVSLLSGHEGGANALAFSVANAIGAEPVISTSTDAAKNLIVGVGCRRGI